MNYKKEIAPLPEGFAEAISKTINRLQHMQEAPASRKSDRSDGDTKPQDISGEEEKVSADKKAPARKGDKSQGEAMASIKEETEGFEIIQDGGKVELEDVMYEATITVKAFTGKAPAGIKVKKIASSSMGGDDVEMTGPDAKLIAYAKKSLGCDASCKTIADVEKSLSEGSCVSSSYKPKAKNEDIDPVNPKAVKKKFDDRKDKDIDNDGDEDESDEYLHKRRKAISKALTKDESVKKPNASVEESADLEGLTEGAQILAHGGKGQYKAVTKGDGTVNIMYKGKSVAKGDFDRGADGWFLSWKDMHKGKKNSRPEGTFFDDAQGMVDFFAKKKITESADLEELNERFSPREIKMAIGIASDKRYAGGNMTGAVKAIDKLKKGLSDHPQVSAVLRRQNEELEEARPPQIQKGKAKGTISATGIRGKGNKKFDVMVGFDDGKFSFRITDESGRFQTVGIKQASKMLGEESVADLTEAKMNEAKNSDYTIYHKTFSSAVQHAIAVAKKRGYAVDEDDWDRKVAMGPRKPSKGKTNSYSINLSKNGKDVRQKLQMQVYYDQGRYELNMYIS